MLGWLPSHELHHIMTRQGLRLGIDRQQALKSLRRNEVHLDLDLLLRRPLVTSAARTLLAPGTQWSQKPMVSLPAAYAPRTDGSQLGAAEVAVVAKKRRRENVLLLITSSTL